MANVAAESLKREKSTVSTDNEELSELEESIKKAEQIRSMFCCFVSTYCTQCDLLPSMPDYLAKIPRYVSLTFSS